MSNTIFNPLDAVLSVQSSASETELKSQSKAMNNDTHGICPKCKTNMSTCSIPKEQVYFCNTCRVSSPLPIED